MAGLRKSKKEDELEVEVQAEEVAVEEIAPLEVKAPEVELVEEQKAEPQVRVKLNADLRTFIGDQWFNFKAGQTYNVPKQVKEILANAGYLVAL